MDNKDILANYKKQYYAKQISCLTCKYGYPAKVLLSEDNFERGCTGDSGANACLGNGRDYQVRRKGWKRERFFNYRNWKVFHPPDLYILDEELFEL